MSHFKAITLITSPGKGMPLVEALYKQNYSMVDLHHARGNVVGAPTDKKGRAVEAEQEIVTCVVDAKIANEAFAHIYEIAGVNKPNGGFLYMQDLRRSSQLKL